MHSLYDAEDGRVHPLYKHIFVPAVAPTLALVGLLWKSLRNPQFELQVCRKTDHTPGICRGPCLEGNMASTRCMHHLQIGLG